MASKQVVRRERSTLAVAKAVEQFIPSISDSLITAVRPQLAAGETMPDVALLGILIKRTLEVRLADFVKANAASEAEASDDVEPRERRDRLEVELRGRMQGGRAVVSEIYGANGLAIYQLTAPADAGPAPLARYSRAVVDALRTPRPDLQPKTSARGFAFQPTTFADDIAPLVDQLETALADVARERAELAQAMLSSRQGGPVHADYGLGAWLEGPHEEERRDGCNDSPPRARWSAATLAPRLGALALGALLVLAVAGATPTTAAAQESPLQAANGAALYLGSLEGILALGIPIGIAMALQNEGDVGTALLCMAVMPLCLAFAPTTANDAAAAVLAALLGIGAILVVPPVVGGVGGAAGWDADGSLVLTSGFNGLLTGGLVGGALDIAAGGGGEIGALLGGLTSSALSVTYSVLRLDPLVRDPRAGVEANLLMWGPPSAMLVSALFLAIAEVDAEIAMFVTGILGLTAQAVAIGLAEAALSEPLPMMMGP